MRAKMSVHEVNQYLSSKNFNLASDKVLKEPQSNPESIWSILVFLAMNIKDSKFEQIEPFIFSLVNAETHKVSLKRIKQYIILSDTLKKITKTNEEYPIKEILKPERQSLNERIALLINANRFVEKTNKEYEGLRTEVKLKKQLIHDLRRKLQSRLLEVEEVKNMKDKEKAQYDQKMQLIENYTKEINYKKKQKLDLINSQQSLDNQLKKKVKMVSEGGYANDDLNIKIKQLEREVIRNAPKLKKERFALIEQYESTMKSNRGQIEIWYKKLATLSDILRPLMNVKGRSKTFKIEQKSKQFEELHRDLLNLTTTVSQDQEHKQQTSNSKRDLLKAIQVLEKTKREISEGTAQEERQLNLFETSDKLLKDEERKNISTVKVLEEKNSQSINQYRTLQGKIRHQRQKMRQRVFELNLRLKNMELESKQVIEQAFLQFN